MKPTVRWSITVSSDTDRRARRLLDAAGRKGDLSKFVEDTVRAKLLELSMQSLPTQARPSANDLYVPVIEDEGEDRQYSA